MSSLLEDFKNSSQAAAGNEFIESQSEAEAGELYSALDEAADCEDVRRMARALAPHQMSDLEDVLREFSASEDEVNSAMHMSMSATRTMEEEDDDMHDELQQLAMSELDLREELEYAQDMNIRLSGGYSPARLSESRRTYCYSCRA
jgi:hypothetical protein